MVGIVRSVEEYGTFIEIAPNLAGLAESCPDLRPGQAVSVYIKNILPEKMKIKLVIVNHALSQSHRFELRYFITEGHLDHWLYSTPKATSASRRIFRSWLAIRRETLYTIVNTIEHGRWE